MPDLNSWPTRRLLSTAATLVEHSSNKKLAGAGPTHAGVIALDVLSTPEEPMSTMAVCQSRDPGPGREYYLEKTVEGKTPREARRALK
ncbi:hypothetical protein [Pseudarthrobacter sp. NPDC080039]|uniref:hypothetical protein n=1 Tax=unclassified Pseudarthrobacter TaxID=2647000 RepID=UPI00345057C7